MGLGPSNVGIRLDRAHTSRKLRTLLNTASKTTMGFIELQARVEATSQQQGRTHDHSSAII